ncbi:hypothetical protein UlMin_008912 [Ulmus minor]
MFKTLKSQLNNKIPVKRHLFFSPTLSYLTSRGENPHILCLSIGFLCSVREADGKGDIRKKEFYHAFAILKVLCFLDHPDLQDGFGKVWDHNLLEKIIGDEVINHNIDLIITFDSYGVSGHCNHYSTLYLIQAWVAFLSVISTPQTPSFLQVFYVPLTLFALYYYVVNVYFHSFTNEVYEHSSHQVLICRPRIV